MRRRDVPYLLAVAVLAVLFAGDVITRGFGPRGTSGLSPAPSGAAGQPRDVDLERLRRLIREGRLSEHEALYAKPLGEGNVETESLPDPGDG